jgi:hypothetical protein
LKRHKLISFTILIYGFFLSLSGYGQSVLEKPTAYVSIQISLGQHNISFKDYASSKGYSFGLNLSLGLYLVNDKDYNGGLQFSLLEGASYEKNRRQKSENFVLPNKDFDKHIIFKFAQFRSVNIGWFNEFDIDNTTVFHRLGFGIFGTTEKDQLFDFSMHNSLGIIANNKENTRFLIGLTHDKQIGIGNPNYTMSNTALTLGGFGNFD